MTLVSHKSRPAEPGRRLDLLQERAATIEDEALRRSYLENVAAHREIVALWEEGSHP